MAVHNNPILYHSFDDLIMDEKVPTLLSEKGNFLKKDGNTDTWKIISLNPFQRFLRRIFGFYRNTHQNNVAKKLHERLSTELIFDKKSTGVKKIIQVAKIIKDLSPPTEDIDISEKMKSIPTKKLVKDGDEERLEGTIKFLVKNKDTLDKLKTVDLPFTLKKDGDKRRFKVRISDRKIIILTNRFIGESKFKTVKTAYDYSLGTPLARAIITPRRFFDHMFAGGELTFLKEIQKSSHPVHLHSYHEDGVDYSKRKIHILTDLPDGNLYQLITELNRTIGPRTIDPNVESIQKVCRTVEKIIISILLFNALDTSKNKNIWHNKPWNVLFQRQSFEVMVADFGLAAKKGDLRAKKPSGSTPDYMPPEYRIDWGLSNGPIGDMHSLGVTLSKLLGDDQPDYIADLIKQMKENNITILDMLKGYLKWMEKVMEDFKELREDAEMRARLQQLLGSSRYVSQQIEQLSSR
ncbi:MAG: hypothetical protein K940chlam7_00703 [Chlamydiae bacterium]|nr:hypothetical protein [Chlamydiota bacterium]